MRKILTLIAVFLFANSALAQSTGPGKTDLLLYGVATRSCGQFLKAQELENQEYVAFVSWLQGYLSAMNLYSVRGRQDIGRGTDVASMTLWLKIHCSNTPLDNFSLAVLKLTSELK